MEKKSVNMRDPVLITQRHIPQGTITLPPLTSTHRWKEGKTGIARLHMCDPLRKIAYDLPEDYTRNWFIQVSPETKGECADIMPTPLPTLLAQQETAEEPKSEVTWTLMIHPVLIYFWGTGVPEDSLKHKSEDLKNA